MSSTASLLAGPVLALVALVAVVSFPRILPPLLLVVGLALLRGQSPHLTGTDVFTLGEWSAEALAVLLVLGFVLHLLRNRFLSTPIYDQELVAHKTMRLAYRTRLRLYVVSPGPRRSIKKMLLAILKPNEYSSLSAIWKELRWRREQRLRRQDTLSALVSAY